MLVIGLTGSIGMGKSTVAEHFASHGIPVCDADREVHKLYAGKAAPLIEKAFPGVTTNGVVDRQKLAADLLNDPAGFKTIEDIVHPLVRQAEHDFLKTAAAAGAKMAVLEIPLLFETGGDKLVDVTVVVSTTKLNQRRRVLERAGMSEQKLNEIVARQMPDADKKTRADFVVDTGGTIDQAKAQVDTIIEALRESRADAYHRHWA